MDWSLVSLFLIFRFGIGSNLILKIYVIILLSYLCPDISFYFNYFPLEQA